MQYIFLSHDVDWRRQGPPIDHILERRDRFSKEIFDKTKPEDLYRNIREYMEIEERFDIRSTFFFRTNYENGSIMNMKMILNNYKGQTGRLDYIPIHHLLMI